MKGNDGSGNNVERDEWQTPKELWNKLNEQYDFSHDCCASIDNNKCQTFSDDFTKDDFNPKIRMAWMNPPFSKASEMFIHFFKEVIMETKVWQDIILKNASWILIPKGRIRYEGMEGKGSRFPSALIGFNVPVPKDMEGTVLMIN